MIARRLILLILGSFGLAGVVGDAAAAPWNREVPENRDGRAAWEAGEYEEAVRSFEEAARKEDDADAQRAEFNRGTALAREGKAQEAERAFDRSARSEDPELRSQALYNRGWLREQRQDYPGAIDDYRRALMEDGGNGRARTNLERLLRMPPPPPQQQPSNTPEKEDSRNNEGEQNEQQKDTGKQDEAQKGNEGEDGRRPQEETEDREASSGDDEQNDGRGEEEKTGRSSGGEDLTEEEADDILESADRESTRPPVRHSDAPPNDYDPSRNW